MAMARTTDLDGTTERGLQREPFEHGRQPPPGRQQEGIEPSHGVPLLRPGQPEVGKYRPVHLVLPDHVDRVAELVVVHALEPHPVHGTIPPLHVPGPHVLHDPVPVADVDQLALFGDVGGGHEPSSLVSRLRTKIPGY
jgi:hypothetical protein